MVHDNLPGFRQMRPVQIFDDPAFRGGAGCSPASHRSSATGSVGPTGTARATGYVCTSTSSSASTRAAGPQAGDLECIAQWRTALAALAVEPNVVRKTSSLGMKEPHGSTASRGPWVLGCIEAFGSERCFFGSNWQIETPVQPLRGRTRCVPQHHRRRRRGGAGAPCSTPTRSASSASDGPQAAPSAARSAYACPRWRPATL